MGVEMGGTGENWQRRKCGLRDKGGWRREKKEGGKEEEERGREEGREREEREREREQAALSPAGVKYR
jgi:hypothetical protein